MAKEKKEKRCKECEGQGKDCECPKKGYYGLDRRHHDDEDNHESPIAQDEGGMSEAVRMPAKPTDADNHMKGVSKQRKEKKMADFKKASDEAKKRQADKNRKGELAQERRTKGIRFYDAKGSGYMRGGKKEYD